jgi:hypothetical protein
MTGSAKLHLLRRAVLSAAIVGTIGVALSLAGYQDQGAPSAPAPAPKTATATASKVPATAAAADPAPTEVLTRLRDDVDRLKIELDLRQQLWRLQQDANRPAWVHAAPWVALAVVGIWVATGWLLYISKERQRVWAKHPDPTTLSTLTASITELKTTVTELRGMVESARTDVAGVTENIQGLWKTLATISTGAGAPRVTSPPITSPRVTSPTVTSSPVTSAPGTPPPVTPPPVTSPPVASAEREEKE